MTEQVAVVHNGIIENFQELRKYLEKKGTNTLQIPIPRRSPFSQAMIERGMSHRSCQKTIESLQVLLHQLVQASNDLMIVA